MTTPRTVVVGGGIVGSSLCYHLAKLGAKVTLVTDNRAGGTSASFAWINASWGNPEPYFRLRFDSMDRWRQLGRELPELRLQWTGSLVYDLDKHDLSRFVELAGSWGYPIRLVERDEAGRLEPGLLDVPQAAAYCPMEGAVEPETAAAVMLRAAQPEFISASVKRIAVRGGRVIGVETDRGLVEADLVATAAGIATPGLLKSVDVDLPLADEPGLLIHTEPLPRLLEHIIIGPDLTMRQTAEGRIVAASDFGGSPVDRPALAIATEILARLRRSLHGAGQAVLDRYTIGVRPMPIDGLPVIGFAGEIEGLYIAVLHSGITNAPAVGAYGAREMLTGERHPLLFPFAPDRFDDRKSPSARMEADR